MVGAPAPLPAERRLPSLGGCSWPALRFLFGQHARFVLTLSVRGGVVDEPSALRAWRLSVEAFGGNEHEPSGEAVLAVSIAKGLTAYDAQFVVTAMDFQVPLVTWDGRMLKAAPDVAVHPREFIERAT